MKRLLHFITLLVLCGVLTGCNAYPDRLQARTVSSAGFIKATASQEGQCLYAGSDGDYHFFVLWHSNEENVLPLPVSAYTTAYKVPRNQIMAIDCERPLHVPLESWRSCEYQLTPRGMVVKERWPLGPEDAPDNQTVSSFFLHRRIDESINGGRGTDVAVVDSVTNIRRASEMAYHSSKTIPKGVEVYPIKVTQHLKATDTAAKLDKESEEASVLFYLGSHREWKAEPNIDHLPDHDYR